MKMWFPIGESTNVFMKFQKTRESPTGPEVLKIRIFDGVSLKIDIALDRTPSKCGKLNIQCHYSANLWLKVPGRIFSSQSKIVPSFAPSHNPICFHKREE